MPLLAGKRHPPKLHPETRNSGTTAIPAKAEIPAKAGIPPIIRHPIIRHSREGGNPYPSRESVIPAKAGIPYHHPSFPRRRESTIPAHAGIYRPFTPMPKKILRHSREGGNVIPAKAGIHNSRACGNLYPNAQENTPSFPRRRESIPSPVIPAKAGISTIPAHAGIYRPRHSREGGNTPMPKKILRHSREGGNDHDG